MNGTTGNNNCLGLLFVLLHQLLQVRLRYHFQCTYSVLCTIQTPSCRNQKTGIVKSLQAWYSARSVTGVVLQHGIA